MTELLLKLAQGIFGLRKDLQQAGIAQRARAADFLSAIAQAIELTAAQLREGHYPAGSCQELLVFSQEMPAVLGGIIGAQKAETFAKELEAVHEIEQLHGELGQLPESERELRLRKLDETAGLFRATAACLKV
ncbi:MAG: hypothetical protein QOC70_195 [Verrucomicrobiota bacterium]|jgi:hypothetical protein